MPDLAHQFGSDLTLGPTGDLATSSGPQLTQERLLRRLLTNQGDYIWQLGYGAGLGRFVGQSTNPQRIKAIIRAQVLKEVTVARVPPPVVTIDARADGTVTATILYADAATGQTQTLAQVPLSMAAPIAAIPQVPSLLGADNVPLLGADNAPLLPP